MPRVFIEHQGCSKPGLLLLYQLLLGEDWGRRVCSSCTCWHLSTSQLRLKQPSIPGCCWQGVEMKEHLHAHVCIYTHRAPGESTWGKDCT